MTNNELEMRMKGLVHEERRITAEILSLINLAEDRRLHLDRGYASLFDWLTRGFGYSASAACRRIDAARLLRTVPDVANKLQSGSVNLTTLAKTRQLLRAQEKTSGRLSLEQVQQAIEVIENKTSDQAEVALLKLLPDAASNVNQERKIAVNSEEVRFSFNLGTEALDDLEWVKAFLSHSVPNGETAVIFTRLLSEFRNRHDPARKKIDNRVLSPKSTAKADLLSKSAQKITTAAVVKSAVWNRAKGQCEYVDSLSGKRCEAKYQLQIDHIIPRAVGGSDLPDNLRCLCSAHNRRAAEQTLGMKWANAWRTQRL